MQNKLITAATIFTSATAMRLQAPTTNLAQAESHPRAATECHGTYAYQCIEEKVTNTLGAMTDEVANHKSDCMVKADDLRADIVSGAQMLRADLERGLRNLRESLSDALKAQLLAGQDSIRTATDSAIDNMTAEAEARV